MDFHRLLGLGHSYEQAEEKGYEDPQVPAAITHGYLRIQTPELVMLQDSLWRPRLPKAGREF